jgi:hypothetical protein
MAVRSEAAKLIERTATRIELEGVWAVKNVAPTPH